MLVYVFFPYYYMLTILKLPTLEVPEKAVSQAICKFSLSAFKWPGNVQNMLLDALAPATLVSDVGIDSLLSVISTEIEDLENDGVESQALFNF